MSHRTEERLSKTLLVPPVAGLILEACRLLALPFSTVVLVEKRLSKQIRDIAEEIKASAISVRASEISSKARSWTAT